MTGKILIVDGHNVIFKNRELKELGAFAIEKLVSILNGGAFIDFEEIIVVFDASEQVRRSYLSGRVKVVLCRKDEKADTVIVEIVNSLSKDYSAYVVSDDFSVQIGAIGFKQLRMTTREFFERIKSKESGFQKPLLKKERQKIESVLSGKERKMLDELYRKLVQNEKRQGE